MVIKYHKLAVLAIFSVYASFLFSPYFNYIVGEGIYFWHIAIILLSPILLLFSFKFFKINYIHFCYLLFFITLIVAQLVVDIDKFSFILRVVQFVLSFLLFISIVYFSEKYSGKQKTFFSRYFKVLLKFVIVFGFIQFIIRIVNPDLILSQYQNYRTLFGGVKQVSSFFYEPRGYAQFLVVTLYCMLFLGLRMSRFWLVAVIISIFLTFSLGAIIVFFVVIALYTLQDISPVQFLKTGLITITLFTLFLFSPPGDFIKSRVLGVFENMESVPVKVVLENSYKLNHVDHYHQYSDQFEKDYGFHGGSETVSIFAEISFLYITLKDNTFFGAGLVDQSRYVSLNAIVDLFTRFGLIGTVLFAYIFGKNHKVRPSLLIFLMFFCALDGALAKPQFWFLLGVLYYYNSLVKDKWINDSSSSNKIFP